MGTGSALNGKEHPNNLTKSSTTTSTIHPNHSKITTGHHLLALLGHSLNLTTKRHQTHPNRTPNGPLEAPKPRPEAPRVLQSAPNNSTEAPQGSQQAPKVSQELPKRLPNGTIRGQGGTQGKKTSEMLINTWENHYSGVKMSINTWENIDPDILFS